MGEVFACYTGFRTVMNPAYDLTTARLTRICFTIMCRVPKTSIRWNVLKLMGWYKRCHECCHDRHHEIKFNSSVLPCSGSITKRSVCDSDRAISFSGFRVYFSLTYMLYYDQWQLSSYCDDRPPQNLSSDEFDKPIVSPGHFYLSELIVYSERLIPKSIAPTPFGTSFNIIHLYCVSHRSYGRWQKL
jgi:hypothetical protein